MSTLSMANVLTMGRKEYIYMKTMDAGWDEELLRVELEALQAEAFDVSLTGFDEKEIADLFASVDEVEDDDFDVDAESRNDECKYGQIATQEDFDRV